MIAKITALGPGPRARGVDERLLAIALFVFWVCVVHVMPASLIDRSDESNFLFYAQQIGHGHYALRGGADVDYLWFGPGLPLLLAPFKALGIGVAVLRLTGPLLLTAAVLLFRRLLLLYVRPQLATAGAVVLACYYPLWRLLPRLYSEPLAMTLLVSATLVGSIGVRTGSRWRIGLAGLLLGGLAMVRLEYGTVLFGVLVLCMVWAALRRHSRSARRAVALSGIACLTCLPWLAYTDHVTGKALYWGNSGGLSLYWMAPQFSGDDGEPHPVAEVFSNPDLARHRPFLRSISGLGPVAHDQALRRRARALIEDDPGGYAGKLAKNFSRLWTRYPYSFEGFGAKTLFYAVPGGVLFLALVASVVVLARRRFVAPELAPFALVGIGGLAAHTVAAGYPRSIAPLIPLALLAIALAIGSSEIVLRPRAAAGADTKSPTTPVAG
jgi:hypothetical protein